MKKFARLATLVALLMLALTSACKAQGPGSEPAPPTSWGQYAVVGTFSTSWGDPAAWEGDQIGIVITGARPQVTLTVRLYKSVDDAQDPVVGEWYITTDENGDGSATVTVPTGIDTDPETGGQLCHIVVMDDGWHLDAVGKSRWLWVFQPPNI